MIQKTALTQCKTIISACMKEFCFTPHEKWTVQLLTPKSSLAAGVKKYSDTLQGECFIDIDDILKQLNVGFQLRQLRCLFSTGCNVGDLGTFQYRLMRTIKGFEEVADLEKKNLMFCPICKSEMNSCYSSKDPFRILYRCSKHRCTGLIADGFVRDDPEDGKVLSDLHCPRCMSIIVKRKVRRGLQKGAYIFCCTNEECRYILSPQEVVTEVFMGTGSLINLDGGN